MTGDSDFEERKQKTLERWKGGTAERERMKTNAAEAMGALKDIALKRTKEKFGLPSEWNEVQCLGSLSKGDAAAFIGHLLNQIEIVSNQFVHERQRRQ